MGTHSHDHKEAPRQADLERPCWRDLLAAALAGLTPSDHHIEKMFDHLEGKG